MRHFVSGAFWRAYKALPADIRERADTNTSFLKAQPSHASLHFKKVGDFWSVRFGLRYRALAT